MFCRIHDRISNSLFIIVKSKIDCSPLFDGCPCGKGGENDRQMTDGEQQLPATAFLAGNADKNDILNKLLAKNP